MIYIYIIQQKIPQVNSKIRSNGKFKGLTENKRAYTIEDFFLLLAQIKTSAIINYGGFINIIYTFAQTLTVRSSH